MLKRYKNTFIIAGLFSLIIWNLDHLKMVILKAAGYQVGYFQKPSEEWKDEFLLSIDTLVYQNDSYIDLIYLPGRDINFKIEKEESGYSRNLLNFLIDHCENYSLNLYYFHTIHNPTSYSGNVDSLEFQSLCSILETGTIELLIGMSHGAELSELLACLYGLKAISIGGSMRNIDSNDCYAQDQRINILSCVGSSNVYCLTGNRDGRYENNRISFKNDLSYYGHHYITDQSLGIIDSLLREITL